MLQLKTMTDTTVSVLSCCPLSSTCLGHPPCWSNTGRCIPGQRWVWSQVHVSCPCVHQHAAVRSPRALTLVRRSYTQQPCLSRQNGL